MLEIAIIEDEKEWREELEEFIQRYCRERAIEVNCTCFQDGDEFYESYKGSYDIIFMDIQMQFMDGMTCAKRIRELDQEVIIIFVTSMVNYAIEGYQVNALDYIVKPISYDSFLRRMDKALSKVKKQSTSITIKIGAQVKRVKAQDIYYIESNRHDLIYVTSHGKYVSREKLQKLEQIFMGNHFFRINRGYLVNLEYVQEIRDAYCVVDGDQLLISRNRKKTFMKALTEYLGERCM